MNFFTSKESRFQLITAFKIILVPLISFSFSMYMIWIFMSMSHLFFESNGFLSNIHVREAFFDHAFKGVTENLIYILIYFILLFFIGIYIASLLLRPFKQIGNYSQESLTNNLIEYKADFMADLRMLTNYSHIFFDYLDNCKINKKFESKVVQEKYLKINGPIFDTSFFLNYSIIILIITFVSTYIIYLSTVIIHESIVDLAIGYLKTEDKVMQIFFTKQSYILNSVHIVSTSLIIILYYSLIKSIIDTISGVEFHFFKTMREFMKGNTNSRIFLRKNDPGHADADKLNKYLDYLQKNLEKKPEE
jgi:hypothetical protein